MNHNSTIQPSKPANPEASTLKAFGCSLHGSASNAFAVPCLKPVGAPADACPRRSRQPRSWRIIASGPSPPSPKCSPRRHRHCSALAGSSMVEHGRANLGSGWDFVISPKWVGNILGLCWIARLWIPCRHVSFSRSSSAPGQRMTSRHHSWTCCRHHMQTFLQGLRSQASIQACKVECAATAQVLGSTLQGFGLSHGLKLGKVSSRFFQGLPNEGFRSSEALVGTSASTAAPVQLKQLKLWRLTSRKGRTSRATKPTPERMASRPRCRYKAAVP